jgi:hypothetical protein
MTQAMQVVPCLCGQVALEADGAPIASAVCYCESCRTAARQFEQAPGAPPVVSADGGVEYCLFRKDRVKVLRGGAHLVVHRLTEASPTCRVVAGCCNAPMFLDVTRAHWLTVYRDRLPPGAPPLEMGVMAKDRPAGMKLRADAPPTYRTMPPKLMIRLLSAWVAMGFRRPRMMW